MTRSHVCAYCGGDPTEPNHARRCDGRQGQLFEDAEPLPDLRGMVHHDDPHTSVAAAVAIERRRNELHVKVLHAIAERGPMTDEELEELAEFRGYGPSTIRKRRSELYQQGALSVVGERINSRKKTMLVWGIVEGR